MKLLAWDTSSKAGAIVALEWSESDPAQAHWKNVRQAGEWSLNVDSRHSERLLWGIHQVLEASRWSLEDVDVFAVGIGPGSFTGLRIGVTTARTLAHTLSKPLIGISSLAALARPVALSLVSLDRGEVTLVAATDACKGELFAAYGKAASVAKCSVIPTEDSEGLWKRDVREQVITPEDLMEKLEAQIEKSDAWLAIGEGRARYPEAWATLPKKKEIILENVFTDQVQGRYLGMLAFEAWSAGLAREALEVHPRYVRASDAEVKLKAGLLKKAPSEAPGELREAAKG